MFISKNELENIRNQIAFLYNLTNKFKSEILELALAQEQILTSKKKRKPKTEEQKIKQREYQRRYRDKQIAKAQQAAA